MEKDFEFEIDKINLIYFKSRQSFEIFKYVSSQVNLTDSFWIQIMYLSFKDTIIELDKLFSENRNQKVRIRNLFNKLKKTGKYREYNFSKRTIMHWENELLRFQPTVETIRSLRDQHFAHTDKKDSIGFDTTSVDYRNIVDNSELESLFDFIKKVMTEIFSQCKQVHIDLELFFSSSNIGIFKQLNDLRKYREKELNKRLNDYKKPSV